MNQPTTPYVRIDATIVDRNIARVQAHFDDLGIALRPHIKTHKIPALAARQIAAGARGITCQKIGEAQVMAAAGIDDILLTYNIVGADKLARLRALSEACRLAVTADSEPVIEGLSKTFKNHDKPLNVLIECDTGHGRCGVQNPASVLHLARHISALPGLQLAGLMTYPPASDQAPVEAFLAEAKRLLLSAGLPCPVISSGGTPNLVRAGVVSSATEHRAGTYIYNDRSLVARGACGVEDCALRVMATIVSRPTDDRAVIDAGSKMLSSDLLGLTGHGLIPDAPGAEVSGLSEEHGIIELAGTDWQPRVGDIVSVIPNHACVVSNLVDEVYFDEAGVLRPVRVAARGHSS